MNENFGRNFETSRVWEWSSRAKSVIAFLAWIREARREVFWGAYMVVFAK